MVNSHACSRASTRIQLNNEFDYSISLYFFGYSPHLDYKANSNRDSNIIYIATCTNPTSFITIFSLAIFLLVFTKVHYAGKSEVSTWDSKSLPPSERQRSEPIYLSEAITSGRPRLRPYYGFRIFTNPAGTTYFPI